MRAVNPVRSVCSIALFLIALLGCASALAAKSLVLAPCELHTPNAPLSVAARCGWLEVAENRDVASAKQVRLKVAVVPALSLRPARDPLFFLTGGPGQAATQDFIRMAGAFARVRRDRDIVLVDQRGTGESNALQCSFDKDFDVLQVNPAKLAASAKECLAKLPGDPRFYTTSVAVRDLDDVRRALGYEQINLWGGSYGTRVAQHYLRRYPSAVRSVVLDGVVPVEEILGPGVPMGAQRAFDAIIRRCDNDRACRAAFPKVAEEFAGVRERLAKHPADLDLPDPISFEPRPMMFGVAHLAGAIRLLSYADATAALMPWLIHQAYEGHLAPIAAQFSMSMLGLRDAIASGMAYSVQCTEDMAFLPEGAADDPALRATYLGREFVDGSLAICAAWPRGVIDRDLHAPLHSTVPALLLSGENDPVTPPAYGERAARAFAQGKHIVVSGQGHIQSATGCVPQLIARFIATGKATSLDTRCATRIVPAPFLLNASAGAP